MNPLRILGKDWEVVREAPSSLGHVAYGHTEYAQLRIVLSEDQHAQQMADTLLHEVLHAIDHTLRLNLTEEQVHALSAGLLAVLRDNPEFAAWLCGFEVAQ